MGDHVPSSPLLAATPIRSSPTADPSRALPHGLVTSRDLGEEFAQGTLYPEQINLRLGPGLYRRDGRICAQQVVWSRWDLWWAFLAATALLLIGWFARWLADSVDLVTVGLVLVAAAFVISIATGLIRHYATRDR